MRRAIRVDRLWLSRPRSSGPRLAGSLLSRKKKTEAPVAFDVFQVFLREGEEALRQRLETLELKALKGIVSQHGFDLSNLAQRWRKKEKLIDLIVERVAARSEKGRVFRT